VDRLLEATALAEAHHFWFRGFRRFVEPLLATAAAGHTNLHLLDCGCGTGSNLDLLGRHGSAWGFDLTWLGLQYAKQRGHTRIAQASIDAMPFPDAFFDVVTSFDVLVCLDDTVTEHAMAEMWRVLKPGGAVIINVAAMPSLWGSHSVLAEEVHRFTRPELRALLTRSGFAIGRLTYTNTSIYPAVALVRLLQRLVKFSWLSSPTAEITVPPAPINVALSALLVVEAWVQQFVSLPFGSSLLCFARKPASR
jgi:SAM-dependent methyltransferase